MNTNLKILALAAALVIPTFPAMAGSTSTTFQVTATVNAACLVSAQDLAFGSYSPGAGSAQAGSTTASVTCTNGTAYTVGLDAGTGASATVAARKMTSGSNTLQYALYRDASHTQVWGTSAGVDTKSGTGTGAAQSLTIYGLIPAGQNVQAGAYTDTITLTVNF